MSKRSKACDITPKVRQHVMERDGGRCINCGKTYMLTLAHIYISRAHGGLGIEQNLAVLCMKCHGKLDNGRKQEIMIVKFNVDHYMQRIYGKPDLSKLKYRKWG